MKKLKCIDSDLLKILAMIFMLLDHLWGTVVSGNQWMTFVGRLAFPIFAFLVAEGFVHTSDFKKYAKRLFLFGIISEIPFNLMLTASPFFPFHQNVMFTLLLGLLCINEIDKFEKAPSVKNGIVRLLMIALFLIIYDLLVVTGSYFGALWLRFDCRFSEIPGEYLTAWLTWALVIKLFPPCFNLRRALISPQFS